MTSKEDSRYPYTYACDWLRMAGLAKSRSDASEVISKLATWRKIPREDQAKEIAGQYVRHFEERERLDDEKASMLDHWRHMARLAEN